ncbi:MAG TPA: DUF4838 domain-containing protein [Chthoniobacteraceae bacterium]|nr:DUF4838 domain-containing protein [Chthoniobacteraceae bacterium]
MLRIVPLFLTLALLFRIGPAALARPVQECLVAEGGKALVDVMVSPKAAAQTRQAAEELAAMLGSISGAKFSVVETSGSEGKGVWVGTTADFPDLPTPLESRGDDSDREAFSIHSEAGRTGIIGLTPLGVQNGVWALLHELGVRQFFPGKSWEIIPRAERLAIAVSRQDRPDFFTRRMVLMVGKWAAGQRDYEEWQKRNLAVSGFDMAVGHAYGRIIKRHEEEFLAHPEYLVDPDGPRAKAKFRIDNPALRALVVRDALEQFRANPALDCVALDPTDGGGWPEASPLGSVSNQVVTLANAVARGLRKEWPGKRVTFYAYSQHSPPPTIAVEPGVIVNIATAFMVDGWSAEELLSGWSRQGALTGIRDYLSVGSWDKSLPGKARASDPDYPKTHFPAWHQSGARYYETEASDSWGPYGLGYYLAHRLLWDVDGADRLEEWIGDFFEKSFGTARAAMQRFFENLDARKNPLFSEHLVGKMYRELADAKKATTDPAVLKRIDDYIKYVRYLELFRVYETAKRADRQEAFEACVKFGYRIRESRMVAPGALNFRESRKNPQIKEVTITPLRQAEKEGGKIDVEAILENGIRNNRVLDFEPVSYGAEWEPPQAHEPAARARETSASLQIRGENELLVYLDSKQPSLKLSVKGGLIRTRGINIHRGPVRISFFPLAHPLGESVAEIEIPADLQEHTVELSSEYPGLHRLLINDGNDLTEVSWQRGARVAVPSGVEKKAALFWRNPYSLLFLVPPHVKQVAGYASTNRGWIEFPDGTMAYDFRKAGGPGYFRVAIPPGMDGKTWRLVECTGERLLLNVPPVLFRSEEEMLVPARLGPAGDR